MRMVEGILLTYLRNLRPKLLPNLRLLRVAISYGGVWGTLKVFHHFNLTTYNSINMYSCCNNCALIVTAFDVILRILPLEVTHLVAPITTGVV